MGEEREDVEGVSGVDGKCDPDEEEGEAGVFGGEVAEGDGR